MEMAGRALGLIEVKGLLGAVVAADIALKAANISLINIETVKSGMKTVQLTGDVGAVRAAVEAAREALEQQPYYLTSHVIARLDEQTEQLMTKASEEGIAIEPVLDDDSWTPVISPKYDLAQLQKLKVVKLRSLAYKEKGIGLSKKDIKFANKQQLLEALMQIVEEE